MNEAVTLMAEMHSPQRSIQSRHVCPTNAFVEFKREEIEQSIPERFEQQARRDPDRLAIKVNSDTLTYDELNRAANRVARAVLAHLPGEGTVALLLEHGASMIASILGVLKAGKIYVPLDPSYPRARNAHILQDSQAALIITNNQNLPLAKTFAQAQNAPQLLNLNESDASLSDQNVGLSLVPDTFAYIVYTSGSTGQPKGVVQNHRNVLHQLMTYTNSLHICADDRLTLLHSCSFSAARLDVFGALLNGATLYPLSIEEGGMVHLANRLIQEEITIYHWVPTPFRHFVGALAGVEEFPKLRLIVLGSESVYPRDVELYKKHFSPGCIFVNRLGTTETGNIRLYFINKGTQLSENVVPAGYALEDTEILILNDADEEVGSGCIGEIAVKSRYLSPGYWRQPDLTRTAFQPDPQGGSGRIYRTGDLGCMLPDGCLMHLGRKDFQVKVRGYRIEIAEIERKLLDSAAVKEAVVVAHEDEVGDKRLVAYIVPHPGITPTIGEVRRLLRAKLPDYMVPSAFTLLDALPLTPTGKVDRLALPMPNRARRDLGESFVAPRTAVEEVVTGMWAEVLGLEQIGVHDSFFDLGGHSLLATQIMYRISRLFRVELSLPRLFEAPTVAKLALAIIANEAKPGQTERIARILRRLKGMSAEDVTNMLQKKREEQGERP
jgi:amino acid adenylation domain-containing protein